ncbi:MAG: type II toxin-antitoxin system VapC family toxin [Planctomycetes bacterium]|nr:type II toxin-antitoxin system VapC family toxin [Planctomycetota bacterium]
MVIDTSAVIAILLGEPESAAFASAIAADSTRLLSAVSYLEAAMLIESRKGPDGAYDMDLLLRHAGVNVVAFDAEQAERARRAYRDFGKGRHPAGLNMGDCCSYALSAISKEPLLFKGDDFSRTDAKRVAPP